MTAVPNPDTDTFEQQVLDRLDRLQASDSQLKEDVGQLREQVERFNDRFSHYQQATQWVVPLAFTLIAWATITVLVTIVLR